VRGGPYQDRGAAQTSGAARRSWFSTAEGDRMASETSKIGCLVRRRVANHGSVNTSTTNAPIKNRTN